MIDLFQLLFSECKGLIDGLERNMVEGLYDVMKSMNHQEGEDIESYLSFDVGDPRVSWRLIGTM